MWSDSEPGPTEPGRAVGWTADPLPGPGGTAPVPAVPASGPPAGQYPGHVVAGQVPAGQAPAVQVPAGWGAPPPPPTPPPGFPPGPPYYGLPAGPPPPPPRRGRTRVVAALVVGLIASVGVGIGLHDATSSSSPNAGFTAQPLRTQQQTNGQGSGNADVSSIADQVDPAVVDITTTLSGGGEAAGTGMVISSSGLVLTNNHVIADSTSIQVSVGGTGSSHTGKVLGYDVADDVAVVQIQGVSGLKTIPIGNSASVSVNDDVVAIGNALGRGGTPSATGGTVTALNQTITASDQGGGNAETLRGLIQVDAGIQPGDSGGPLVDTDAKVVGMDTAASTGGGGFGFDRQASSEGYAIPIERAISIAQKIASGNGGTNIHLGSTRALLGVSAVDNSQQSQSSDPFGDGNGFGGRRRNGFNGGNGNSGNGSSNSASSGATVRSVASGSAADSAGIVQGDVITSVGGQSVDSASSLATAVTAHNPHDRVQVGWTDSSGNTQHATVELGSGPPA